MGHTICRHLHNNVDDSNVQVECKFVAGGFPGHVWGCRVSSNITGRI